MLSNRLQGLPSSCLWGTGNFYGADSQRWYALAMNRGVHIIMPQELISSFVSFGKTPSGQSRTALFCQKLPEVLHRIYSFTVEAFSAFPL